MAKIMTVCKDRGATNVVAPIAQVLHNDGHEVFPIVEGMGADQWPTMCQVPPIFDGKDGPSSVPFWPQVVGVLECYRADVVVVGESFPNRLEGEFARAAQQLDSKLVLAEDFWGGATRLELIRSPELVLTLDEYAARLARTRFPEARVIVTGNPGVREGIIGAPEVLELRTGGDLVITFCGGGPETTEQIQLLLQCLDITDRSWRLIPRWHPAEADLPDPDNSYRPYREIWDVLLESIRDRVIRVDGPSTDSVVVASNLVLAGFSTLLTTAANAGVAAVALATAGVLRVLREESGLGQIPQVALGAAHLVTAPTNLASLQPCSEEVRDRLMPFDPAKGAAAICALLEGR